VYPGRYGGRVYTYPGIPTRVYRVGVYASSLSPTGFKPVLTSVSLLFSPLFTVIHRYSWLRTLVKPLINRLKPLGMPLGLLFSVIHCFTPFGHSCATLLGSIGNNVGLRRVSASFCCFERLRTGNNGEKQAFYAPLTSVL